MEHNQNGAVPEVTVQFAEREYFTYVREVVRPFRMRRIVHIGAIVFLAVVMGFASHAIVRILGKTVGLPGSAYFLAYMGFFLPLYLGALRFFRAYFMRGHFNPRGAFFRAHRYQLFPDYFTVENDVSFTRLKWRGVLKITANAQLILLYIDNMQAYILPRQSFATPEAAEAFYQQALVYWQAAQAASPDAAT